MEDHQVEDGGHPHAGAHVDPLGQHVEAEIDHEDLHGDHHTVEDAGQDAGLEILPEGPAVGGPPVARLIPQGAQHRVVDPGPG